MQVPTVSMPLLAPTPRKVRHATLSVNLARINITKAWACAINVSRESTSITRELLSVMSAIGGPTPRRMVKHRARIALQVEPRMQEAPSAPSVWLVPMLQSSRKPVLPVMTELSNQTRHKPRVCCALLGNTVLMRRQNFLTSDPQRACPVLEGHTTTQLGAASALPARPTGSRRWKG